MKVVFTELYERSFASIISKRAVERVIREPDKIEELDAGDGSTIVTRSKLLSDPERGDHYAVVSTIDRGDQAIFQGGFRIRQDVVATPETLTPSGLLEALANRCGQELQAGNTRGNYIEHAELHVASANAGTVFGALKIPQIEGRPWITTGRTRFDPEQDGFRMTVEQFFCVDRLEYLKWWYEGVPR